MNAVDYGTDGKQHQRFYPYDENGGSIIALAGDDFAIIASDTRLTTGYSIYTRDQSKLFKLTDNTVLGTAGCWCDAGTITKVLEARLKIYEHEHNKTMSSTAVAQMLATMLYHKRFFPYYLSNILAGLDEEGKGCVYSYDPVGFTQRETVRAGGSATALLQPLLDNQVMNRNMDNVQPQPMTLDRARALIKDAFISAAERDIHTGDAVVLNIITKDGVVEEQFPLRKD